MARADDVVGHFLWRGGAGVVAGAVKAAGGTQHVDKRLPEQDPAETPPPMRQSKTNMHVEPGFSLHVLDLRAAG